LYIHASPGIWNADRGRSRGFPYELLYPPVQRVGDKDVALRAHGEEMRLAELAGAFALASG
jgi:hypothetical protein